MDKKLREAEEKFRQALTLLNDKDVFTSEREATLLLEEAADLGHSEAMFNLAMIFQNGLNNVLQNTKKAIYYFQKAYDAGITNALPFLVEYSANKNDTKEIINNLDELQNMIKCKNQDAGRVMCIVLKKYTDKELDITIDKRKSIIRDISFGGFPLDIVPYTTIKYE